MRQRLNADSVEQIVLDLESIAAGQKYFELANYVISPDGRRVAYAVDFTGARTHRVFVRDIATGAEIDTGIDQAASDLAFSADSDWLFFIRTESGALRSHQLWVHAIGSPGMGNRLIFEEEDPTSDLQLSRSRSGRFLLIRSSQGQSTEIHI